MAVYNYVHVIEKNYENILNIHIEDKNYDFCVIGLTQIVQI